MALSGAAGGCPRGEGAAATEPVNEPGQSGRYRQRPGSAIRTLLGAWFSHPTQPGEISSNDPRRHCKNRSVCLQH